MRRFGLLLVVLGGLVWAPATSAKVLLVGSYHGIKGKYGSIQAAVDAARAGDWILVGPGDYKTTSSHAPSDASNHPAGVLITTANLRLRGMNRNTVIVDGTKSGPKCSSQEADQNFGPADNSGGQMGLNGIMVYKADDVWVQNLTACNFLAGTGSAGNEIWWNGGDGQGKIQGWGYNGSYLNATSTFFKDESTAMAYGIFSSDWSGGTWYQDYASNASDSNYYVGACQQVCDQTLDTVWSEYSSLGYSGTNAGGQLVIKNSQFDNNQDGFDTNSQNNDDFPSPQDGSCPNNGVSPITHTHSCWVFMNNFVHDNNNPNVPGVGVASSGPVGTGMSISGGRDDTVMNNRFVNNGAWGTIFVPYPDTETPPPDAPSCAGGVGGPGNVCNYDDWGNALQGNTYTHNGFFGNDTNGDFAEITTLPGHPINCYQGNTDTGGAVTSSPSNLQSTNANCGQTAVVPDPNPPFLNQVACDSQFFASALPSGSQPCTPGSNYPRRTQVVMHPLPTADLPTMPNPCAGVPPNPWCNASAAAKHAKHRKRHRKAARRISRPPRTRAGFTG